ncbi:hypothetical protein TSUD_249060 [Trifolium subterraneum]|nr:hypothetical protein TSUD_249060 [Trifolium subterraneum]
MDSSKGKAVAEAVTSTTAANKGKAVAASRKVLDLRPGMDNITITLKFLDAKEILKRPWILETTVGDDTGVIMLKTRVRHNKQVRSLEGRMVTVRNSRVELFKGSMRLMMNDQGIIQPSNAEEIIVDVSNNFSLLNFNV